MAKALRSTGRRGAARLATLAMFATLGALGWFAGCASPDAQECGATGIFCPAGTHCAAAQGICLPDTNTCGNAHLDPGEKCDDGNTNDGDGCSHDCLSNETCGNGVIDTAKGEICDDGNTKDGDGCSHDCLSDETCGNKIVDTAVGELCDDGNDIIGDGCSHNCRSLEVCGNGIVDPGEACDLLPQDLSRCSADCKSTLQCGNGEVDPGEECDVLANDDDHNDCRGDCFINRCGDGFVDTFVRPGTTGPVEQCDGADPATHRGTAEITPTETAGCNLDCTTPSCGDGKLNRHFAPDGTHPEQCDDGGANADTAACTSTCQAARCGDHLVEAGIEQCDDGDSIDTNGCTNGCKLATCGDGILQAGIEQCDDHNTASGDGCSSSCVIERCGDSIINNTHGASHEDCDTGGASQTCNVNCTTPRCGDGIVNTAFTPTGGHGPEQCDDGNNIPGDGCSADCQFERCGNHIVDTDAGEECDDGNNLPGDGCFHCHLEKCGNGILDQGEQCDDGNTSDTDACVSNTTAPTSCKIAVCGDGHVEAGVEDCDHGTGHNGAIGDTCSATCHTVACGNGFVEQGEQCDDGNASDTDDCLTSGTSAGTKCVIATCGDGVVDSAGSVAGAREDCDHGTGHNGAVGDTCSATCHTVACGNGVVEQGEQCDDGPGNNAAGKPCNASCQLNVCGDGDKLVGIEQCDEGVHHADGTNTPTDTNTCDSDCTFPVCGDHHFNPHASEQCDTASPGNNSDTGACTTACEIAVCGDGFIEAGTEQCDDPTHATSCAYNAAPSTCTVCDPVTCQHTSGTAHFCGDGQLDADFEVCDDKNSTCGTCSADCRISQSAAAQGLIFAPAGNQLVSGTDTFTLNDGFLPTVTFEFNTGTVSDGNVKVPFLSTDTNVQVATKIATAISVNGNLGINATSMGPIVVLVNQRFSTLGNGTSSSHKIVESVASSAFAVIDMTGGLGGDCGVGQACADNEDCASELCVSGLCTPP